MIKKIFFLQVLAIVSSVSAQTIMTIQNEPVSTEEFKKIYLKNNPKSNSFSRKDLVEYVDLFVLYKMKLLDAKELRLDTIQAVKVDYTKYTDQLAQNILNDKNYVDNIVKETYEHTKSDLKLAHIMVKCDPNASPKDSLLAYNKMKFIKDKITSQNFAEMAKENSEDKASAVNGGMLGYITAFMTTSDFESVAYATPLGAVSNIIRTNIGFHILKVIDKRPARGRVKVAHIYTNNQKEEDEKANLSKTQIDEAYKNITSKKMTFEEAVAKYSIDKSTSEKGGELPEFGISEMIGEFEERAYGLKNIGDVSQPFKTDFGWHIVKLLDKIPVKSFEESKVMIKQKLEKDPRISNVKAIVLDKIQKKYQLKENGYVLDAFQKSIPDTFFKNKNWILKQSKEKDQALFTIDNRNYSLSDFASYLNSNFNGTLANSSKDFLGSVYREFRERMVWDYAKMKLKQENEEFRMMDIEYQNGLMIFELMDREIWKKAVLDTIGAKKLYEEVKNDYKYGQRVEVYLVKTRSKEIAEKVKAMAKTKKSLKDAFASLKKTKDSLEIIYDVITYEKGELADLDKQDWKVGATFQTYFEDEKTNAIGQIVKVIEPMIKPFADIRGRIQNLYQTRLEQQYHESLRKKYSSNINQIELNKIIKD